MRINQSVGSDARSLSRAASIAVIVAATPARPDRRAGTPAASAAAAIRSYNARTQHRAPRAPPLCR